jgi:hypothetical protein
VAGCFKCDNEFSGSLNPVNLQSEEILAAMKRLYSMDLVSYETVMLSLTFSRL